jgi:3-deoxy-D-manno-octulosonic-acid transferase
MNAQVSQRSFARWWWARSFFQVCFRGVLGWWAVSEAQAQRLRLLGAEGVQVVGSLKWTAPVLPVEGDLLAFYQTAFGSRHVLLAASTHPGEESFIIEAYARLRLDCPDLCLVIAPRHVQRVPEIEALVVAAQMTCARSTFFQKQRGQTHAPLPQVLVVDEMGRLGVFYRLACVVCVGGSLVPHIGGHNVIEPLACGSVVVHGPFMEKQEEVVARLTTEGLLTCVATVAECVREIGELLRDAPARAQRAERGQAFVDVQKTALLAAYLKNLSPCLKERL